MLLMSKDLKLFFAGLGVLYSFSTYFYSFFAPVICNRFADDLAVYLPIVYVDDDLLNLQKDLNN